MMFVCSVLFAPLKEIMFSLCWFVCLSVNMIPQNVVDEL